MIFLLSHIVYNIIYKLIFFKIPDTDIVIEKGTAVYVSLYGMHEDDRFFDEPLVFNPNRFDNDMKISDAYLPFGIGPRSCVGKTIILNVFFFY